MNSPQKNSAGVCERMILCVVLLSGSALAVSAGSPPDDYTSLVRLFQQWRVFERPSMKGDVPDYSPNAMAEKAKALPEWQKKLAAIDDKSWPIEQQNDHKLVQAEMNGFAFNFRVLRPWARDPLFM